MDNKIKNRTKIYDEIRRNCNINTDHGIYLDIKLEDSDYDKLKLVVSKYITVTLDSYYKDKVFDYNNDFLVKYKEEILNLPNRTPNGAFYPKLENIKQYNKIQSTVNDILIKNNLVNYLNSFDVCTVRIMEGDNYEKDERNTSTTILHSDAWPGHDGDAILTVGLLGDETTSLEFNKPVGKISDDFFDAQVNYLTGLDTFEDVELIGNLKFGYFTIFDHGCIHRTIKSGGGLRVSLDFGIVVKNSEGIRKLFKYDEDKRKGRKVTHSNINETLKIGKETFIEATETLDECYNRFKDDNYDKIPVSHISDNLVVR